jgi:hypothetical protein
MVLRIKRRHSSGRFSLAAFASLRLGENRRLNKEDLCSQRRKGAAIYFSKTISLSLAWIVAGQTKVCPTLQRAALILTHHPG